MDYMPEQQLCKAIEGKIKEVCMKTFNRVINIILAISILMLNSVALASTNDHPGIVKVIERKDGTYVTVISDSLNVKTAKNVKKAKETKYDEIYLTEDNIYLMKAAHDKYVPVDKIDLDLLNKQVLKKTLSQHKLSKEVRETIEKRSDSAIAANNTDAKATLFTTSSTYYTYNGHYMRSDKLYSYGLNTGWEYIEEGTDTAEVADSITGIALSAAGVSNVFVGIVSLGKTVLDFFTDQCDLIITGHRDDFLQMSSVR